MGVLWCLQVEAAARPLGARGPRTPRLAGWPSVAAASTGAALSTTGAVEVTVLRGRPRGFFGSEAAGAEVRSTGTSFMSLGFIVRFLVVLNWRSDNR